MKQDTLKQTIGQEITIDDGLMSDKVIARNIVAEIAVFESQKEAYEWLSEKKKEAPDYMVSGVYTEIRA